MSDLSLLESQIAALKNRLLSAQQIMNKTRLMEPDLFKGSGDQFNQLIAKQRDDIKKLEAALDNRTKLEKHWKNFLDIKKECKFLFGEILAFHGGVVVRRTEFDQRIYQVADELCRYLSEYTPVKKLITIPGPEDKYTGMTDIIRMRFLDFSIWGLPVIAHEFGHYLEENERKQRFPELFWNLLEGKDLKNNLPFLKEQFADLFATYALGPAYAGMCIFLEFDPYKANQTWTKHPTYAERVYFILAALRKMDSEDKTLPNKVIIDRLEQTWSENLKLLDQNPIIKDQILDQRIEEMYKIITNREIKLAGVRYNHRYRTSELTDVLDSILTQKYLTKEEMDRKLVGKLLNYKDRKHLVDIFNIAWLHRLENKRSDPNQISEVTLAMCHHIMSR